MTPNPKIKKSLEDSWLFQHSPRDVSAPEMLPESRMEHPDTSDIAGVASSKQGEIFPPMVTSQRFYQAMYTQMPSLGLLDTLLDDPTVDDILVNGISHIYVDKHGKMVDSGLRFESHEVVWDIAQAIVKSVGQSLSFERPMIDTRLPDGSRVNIVAPPMAVDGVNISIRKFPARHITLKSMIAHKQISKELAMFLSESVRLRLNIVVCGGTGSGKTTLLNALSSAISANERIVTIEDSAELRLQQPHVVRLEARTAQSQQHPQQEVTVRDLVKNALRMRPDRIVVGESRGEEAFDMLQAMNTGHDGSMTTLHANSPRDALSRLETMVSMAMPQLPLRLVRQQIASSAHLIINTARCSDGQRRITHISEVAGMEGDTIIMQDLVVYVPNQPQQPYRWVNVSPRHPLVTDAARLAGMMRPMR